MTIPLATSLIQALLDRGMKRNGKPRFPVPFHTSIQQRVNSGVAEWSYAMGWEAVAPHPIA